MTAAATKTGLDLGEPVLIDDPRQVRALFSEGLSLSLLSLPRPGDARALLERALRSWFPSLLRSGHGAIPIGLALDLGGMLLSGKGSRLTAAAGALPPDEPLDARAGRVLGLRSWMERSAEFRALRKALAQRRDAIDRLDGPVLALLRRSSFGRAAGVSIPTVAASSDAVAEALGLSTEHFIRPARSGWRPYLRPFLDAWLEGLASARPLWDDPAARLEAEASIYSRTVPAAVDFPLLARAVGGAGDTAAARSPLELTVPARSRLSERAGSRVALASGGYTGIRRLQGLEDIGRLLPTEWALPEEALWRRVVDREAAVLEMEGREEPSWRVLFTVAVFLDGRDPAGDAAALDGKALALWVLDDIARALAPGSGQVEAEIAVIGPDPGAWEHYRFPLACGPASSPLFLREPALFPSYFLRSSGGAGAGQPRLVERRRSRDPAKGHSGPVDGPLDRDVERGPSELALPPSLRLACHESKANAEHVVAVLPLALEYGARYRIEVEEPFGALDLTPAGADSLSLVFAKPPGWLLRPAGYASVGAAALETAALRRHLAAGILQRSAGRR